MFLVGDDAAVCASVVRLSEAAGLGSERFRSLRSFLDAVPPGRQGCLVIDAECIKLTSREHQADLAEACTRMTAVILAHRGDVAIAVRGIKAGAADIVEEPYNDQQLLDRINKALKHCG